MTEPDDLPNRISSPTGAADSHFARILWFLLIVATLYLCYFHRLGAAGFVGPDEPRYAWIARDMAESGDLVTPRLYGKPWFEKPVLYYWAAAKTFRLSGASEASARFPSAFCALLATLAMAWLARKLYGDDTARWLLLVMPTTVAMIGFSHAAATDMLFSGMLAISMVCAASVVGLTRNNDSPIVPRTPWVPLLLFGFFLGLAVLAKGPAAIILAGATVFLWAALSKRWQDAFRCLHPVAITSFSLTALPWYILCAIRNPEFLHVFLIEHNFKRFLTPEFQHIQPFWFYIPIILVAVFPWTVLSLCGLWRAAGSSRRALPGDGALLFFLCWPLVTLLFFSLSKSKLPGYILPAVPALLFLVAWYATVLVRDGNWYARWLFVLSGILFSLLGLGLRHYAWRIPAMQCVSPLCGITRIWLVAFVFGLLIVLLGLGRQYTPALVAMVLATLMLVNEIDRFLVNLDPGISARDATIVVRRIWPDFSAEKAATWQLDREYVYQLNFYFERELLPWQPDQPKPDWLFVSRQKRQEAIQQGFTCATYAIDPAVVPCRSDGSPGGLARNDRGERGDGQLR